MSLEGKRIAILAEADFEDDELTGVVNLNTLDNYVTIVIARYNPYRL